MKVEPKLVKWREGYPSTIDAKVAYQEIEKLRLKGEGAVTPEAVIDAASKKRNPLHPAFDWNDATAAESYRMAQARGILRSIVVIRKESPKRPSRVYEIERIPATESEPNQTVYRTMEDILRDPVTRADLLQRALRDLVSCQKKYGQLKELAMIFRAVEEALVTVKV